jgi:hypothetical protein
VEKLIEMLENDPTWVPLYNITGEIHLSKTKDADEELQTILTQSLEVS